LVGLLLGFFVGDAVGLLDGESVGLDVGILVGDEVGFALGLVVGFSVGFLVGGGVQKSSITHVLISSAIVQVRGLAEQQSINSSNTLASEGAGEGLLAHTLSSLRYHFLSVQLVGCGVGAIVGWPQMLSVNTQPPSKVAQQASKLS